LVTGVEVVVSVLVLGEDVAARGLASDRTVFKTEFLFALRVELVVFVVFGVLVEHAHF